MFILQSCFSPDSYRAAVYLKVSNLRSDQGNSSYLTPSTHASLVSALHSYSLVHLSFWLPKHGTPCFSLMPLYSGFYCFLLRSFKYRAFSWSFPWTSFLHCLLHAVSFSRVDSVLTLAAMPSTPATPALPSYRLQSDLIDLLYDSQIS